MEVNAVQTADSMTRELLAEFGEAWNRHDADLLMEYMAESCSYQASFGPELEGRDYSGREAVREGFARFFEAYPDGRFVDSEIWAFDDDRAACVWTFVATAADGGEQRVRGCDLFEFDGAKIRRKNAFRKQK
jgi:ketosteroid isomerase-like protein